MQWKWTIQGGVFIEFSEKPAGPIRSMLKANGFRWVSLVAGEPAMAAAAGDGRGRFPGGAGRSANPAPEV